MGIEDHRKRRDFAGHLRDNDRPTDSSPARLHQENTKNTAKGTGAGAKEVGEYRPRKLQELVDTWMKDPAFREAYENTTIEFLLMLEVSSARARSGLTQAEIARRMGTTQSAVARLETERLPSLRTLKRYAEAVGAKLVVKLEAKG